MNCGGLEWGWFFHWPEIFFLLLPVFLFPAGALSFLTAHIFYIIGLNQTNPAITWQSLLLVAAVAVVVFLFAQKFFRSLKHRHSKRLKALIIVYMLGISTMLPLRPADTPASRLAAHSSRMDRSWCRTLRHF